MMLVVILISSPDMTSHSKGSIYFCPISTLKHSLDVFELPQNASFYTSQLVIYMVFTEVYIYIIEKTKVFALSSSQTFILNTYTHNTQSQSGLFKEIISMVSSSRTFPFCTLHQISAMKISPFYVEQFNSVSNL